MTPAFANRIPRDIRPNPWSAALASRRLTGAPLLDLTESNPTRVGLPDLLAGAPPHLANANLRRYEPDALGLPRAREAIAARYAEHGVVVAAEDIVLTTGTSESLAHLVRLLADPGGTLLVPEPGYPLFGPIAAAEGARVSGYRLAYDGRWHLDRDSFERALFAKPRAVVCVEPHLPAGTCLPDDDWDLLVAAAAGAGVPLIVDEVFTDYAWTPGSAGFPSRAAETRTLTFTLSGLSKVCGLPQLKLGWIVIAGPAELRKTARAGLEWLGDLFLSVGTPVQLALPDLLARRAVFQQPMRERLLENLGAVDAWAARQGSADRLYAEGGWVCVLRLPAMLDDEGWALELLARDVVVYPGHFYDLAGGSHLVLSLIVEPAVMREGLARLGRALAAR